ncbi:DUF3703 domain-containing protein [Gramella sp. KN1008]|uniref:DUF3703 domain-containing protein n=1 Tax=Gramella sp. KN1008 TaxID=2529298 RepID=UPI001040515A|nr:DUF3703 domain-containing protein [Gramella sp. KN1008]
MPYRMPRTLKVHYREELANYYRNLENNDHRSAWRALERSHVLGQAFTVEHTYSHWLMLNFGFRIKSLREVLGQIPRLLVGGVKSFVGTIPVGNTGGANVPPLRSMPIEADLKAILDNHKNKTYGRS